MDALVIGADSGIGAALIDRLAMLGHSVKGTSRHAKAMPSDCIRLDLTDPNVAETPVPHADIVFFCAAMTRYAECRANPELARMVNATAPAALARRLAKEGARVVLLSTSAVFDGTIQHVDAMARPCPLTVYGHVKAEAEERFLALGDAASILRLSKVMTLQMPLLRSWIEALTRGESISAFTDLSLAPITMDDAVAALVAIAQSNSAGIHQYSAATDITYSESARHLASKLRRKSEYVLDESAMSHGVRREEAPRYTSLDSSRVEKLAGRPSPTPFSVLDRLFRDATAAARNMVGQTPLPVHSGANRPPTDNAH